MRVNVYAEEMTNRVEIVEKDGFTGLRIYLELPASYIIKDAGGHKYPATVHDKEQAQHFQAPFIHQPGDDDSSAVTFWGKRDLRVVLQTALDTLNKHYADRAKAGVPPYKL